MNTPQANMAGYNNGSVTNRAANLANREYLLVHGTGGLLCGNAPINDSNSADDNVHMQNSLELSKQLVLVGIPFQEMMYTNCILSLGPFPYYC